MFPNFIPKSFEFSLRTKRTTRKGKMKNSVKTIQKTSPLKLAGKMNLTRRIRRAQKPIRISRWCFFRKWFFGDRVLRFMFILYHRRLWMKIHRILYLKSRRVIFFDSTCVSLWYGIHFCLLIKIFSLRLLSAVNSRRRIRARTKPMLLRLPVGAQRLGHKGQSHKSRVFQ